MDLTGTSPARVLLVEDDAISREVLAHAVRQLPADVSAVATLADARAVLATHHFAVWLVDAHLPDGQGTELLALRPAATVALAHTASTDTVVRDRLIGAGFEDVLVKPIPALALQAAVRRWLRAGTHVVPAPQVSSHRGQPVWDDAAALRALAGNLGHVRALRGLFANDLDGEVEAIGEAQRSGNEAAVRACVHRLRASCGFVGASRVAAALPALDAFPLDADAYAGFVHAATETKETPHEAGIEAGVHS